MNRFAWHEIRSTDVDKSRAFYTALFGWTTEKTDMSGFEYEILVDQDVQFGGLTGVSQAGVPSHWMTTVRVEDVDAATSLAKSLGATIHFEPTTMESVGRFSVFSDPQGASIALLTDENSLDTSPADPTVVPAGGVIWHELATSDVAGAKDFYGKVLGWGSLDRDMGSMIYSMFTEGDQMAGGLIPLQDGMPVSAWRLYFHVSDIDAAVKQVTALGGNVIMAPMQIPAVGRWSVVSDPTGGVFSIMTPDMPTT